MSTTLAKVAYNNVIRQISLSAEESTSPELLWSKLQDDLRRVHGIPVGSSFYLTYTDEDGDTITLDTGVELLELVRNTTRSIRFELILREVAAGITESPSVPVSTEPVTYPAVTEPGESTEEATAPPQSEKKKPEEQEKPSEKSQPEPSASSSSSSSTGPSGPSNNNDPISSLLESIQPLLSSLSSNPEILRGIIGNIGEQAAAHIEPFIQNLNESIRQQQTASSSSTTSGTENTETPFAGGRCGPGAARGWGGPGAHPWGAGFGHPWAQAFANSGHPWAQAFRNAQEQYFQQQQGETSQDAPTQTLSDDQVNEKLASLQGLGLGWDNVERTKELLRRYEGNVDRVAEVLLREQE